MKNEVDRLLKRQELLVHSERKRIVFHAHRKTGEWIVNAVMREEDPGPFRFKRKTPHKNLKGMFVNLTSYPRTELVAGIDVEVRNRCYESLEAPRGLTERPRA